MNEKRASRAMKFSPITLAAVMTAAVLCAGALDIRLSIAAAGALAVFFIARSVYIRKIDVTALILLLGFCAVFGSYSFFSSSAVHKSTLYFNKEVSVSGVVITAAQESPSSDNYKYTLHLKSITENGYSEKTNENILLTTPEKLRCGESITAAGKIKPLPGQMNEYGFDYGRYYKSQGTFSRIYSEDISSAAPMRVFSFSIISGKFREAADNMIYRYYSGDAGALLSAVITGNYHHFSPDFDMILNRTSFKRQLHPAFIHIMLIMTLTGIIGSFIPKRFRDVFIIAFLLILAVFNCSQIGFLRCVLICAMTVFFRIKNGSAYYPDTLSWFIVICAIVSPLIFFNSSFIMSLSAGVIMWAFMPLAYKFVYRVPNRLRRTSAVMLVCAVFYTPVSCFYFNGMCIYAFLLPFIMVPLVTAILLLSPAVLLCLGIFGRAYIIKPYLDLFIYTVLKLPHIIEKLPLSYVSVPTPPLLIKAAIIGGLFTVFYLTRKNRRRMKLSAAVSSLCLAAFAVILVMRIGTTQITFVNTGQSEGSVIHTAFGKTIIIDGGGGVVYSDYDPGRSIFVPYLQTHGYTSIDAAFLSHFHQDHVQGIIAAVDTLRVKRVYTPAPCSGWDEDMYQWLNRLCAAAEKSGTKIICVSEDCEITIDSGISVSVYVPDDAMNSTGDDNDQSLLFKVHCRGNDFLYTGDITSRGEKIILDRGIDTSADVLKVGHHGSAGSTSEEWLSAVSPDFAVISCGENNVYGHPKPVVLERLSGIPVYRTDKNGDISFTVSKNGIRNIHTMKNASY